MPRIPDTELERLKEEVSVERLVEASGVELKKAGVTIHVCANAARSRGYKPDEFYDVITVVPAAVIDIARWQNQGYSYMYAEWFPRLTREELVKQNKDLQ